jgi:phage gpG-like protein
MAYLEFRVDGDKVLSRNLRIIADSVGDMRQELGQIGDLVRTSAVENLESGGSEGGGKWKPLAPKTVRMRAKRQGYYKNAPAGAGPSGPVLQWTGRLKNSFRSTPEALQVTIDNPVPYFKHHQAKERTSEKLPRRLVLELKQADKLKAMNIIAGGLQKKLEGGNFGRQF